jgi:hypothetical protein
MEADPVPIELASEDQVKEINRLLSLVNIPEKEIESMLSRAKADSVAELSAQHATAMQAWLLKKVMQ